MRRKGRSLYPLHAEGAGTLTSKKRRDVATGWAALTWDDLDGWAGSRSVARGRSYERQGRVKNLAVSEDGRLLATVQGGERYVVSVGLSGKKSKNLESHCTCPVGCNCKHAVATVAAYLQALTDGATVPTAEKDDPRWDKLSAGDAEFEDDWDDSDDVEDDDDSEEDDAEFEARLPKRRSRRTRTDWDNKIERLIRGKNREELADQVLSLVERYPELREEFRERIALSEGDVDRLVALARREMRDRAEEIGWQNHWQGEGHTPDYSHLKHRLERLVELGHADAVVELGREFIKRAMTQVGESHDEGETAMAVAECLSVVFDAVAKSSLSGPQKILFAVDACLNDGYDVIGDSAEVILDAGWKPADWSAVADELTKRLQKVPQTDDPWHRNYQRDRISDWLLTALENAGRGGELRAIYETEARMTGSYERLVRHLIAQKRFDDAERWANEGIEKTREKLPGIASSLAALLREVASGRKRWDIVAAHAAWQFFGRPAKKTFDELVAHAGKAKCGQQVRTAALYFLETGTSPFQWVTSSKTGHTIRVDSAWPLPVPDYLVSLMRPSSRAITPHGPHYNVLLDMAIAANRPDDVLRWYDKMLDGRKRESRGWSKYSTGYGDRVAAAVAQSHPERALEIYRQELDGTLPQAHVSAYEAAAGYLKKMRPIMKSLGREADWAALLGDVRLKHRNRPRFMEILDKLDGRTILQSQKARR
jgi:uncharacterized Zn finger protein